MAKKTVVNEADFDWFKSRLAKGGQALKNLMPGQAGSGLDYREAGANKAADLFKKNVRDTINELQRDLKSFTGKDPKIEGAVAQLINDLEPLVSSMKELK